MVDWELMVPGMGLTILGLAGVGLSLAGIARTFVEGMHAISALMMVIGMIILAAGILKDGLPTSNTAKAAAVIIIGFLATIGAFLIGMSTVSTLPLFAGTLLLIMFPAAAIAYAAHKRSAHLRAIAILFSSASLVGAIAFVSFGFVAPHPIEAGVIEKAPTPAPAEEFKGPKLDVTILEGASKEGSPAFKPSELMVKKGTMIVWTNADTVVHTVTSGIGINDPKFGSLFDSQSIKAKATFSLDTTKLELGEYNYFCTFHPYMKGKFTIAGEGAPAEPTKKSAGETPGEERPAASTVAVDMVAGASNAKNPEFFAPHEITVTAGTTVVWSNKDTAGHTVTSGNPGDADAGSLFDSTKDPSGFLVKPAATWQHTFDKAGEFPYFCQVHPWMTAKVIVK